MRTVTLGEMLGPELVDWVFAEFSNDRLTNDKLREKLESNRALLENKGVDAGYAYYATLYVLGMAKKTLDGLPTGDGGGGGGRWG